MDYTGLAVGIGLMLLGALLIWVGTEMKRRDRREAVPEPIIPIIVDAIKRIVAGAKKIVAGPTPGDRVQGLGTVIFWIGVLVIIGWVLMLFGLIGGQPVPPASPSPAGSPSPAAS